MTTSMLDRAIYSYSDVDRLVGLHSGTARRWLDGYTRAGKFYEPILREASTGAEVVTWGEMVEARLLAEFRSRDVTVQRLRPAIEQLRERFGRYPLALARPFLEIEGRELVQVVQEEVGLDRALRLVVVRNGQSMLTAATERFSGAVRYVGGAAGSVQPDPRTPSVVMDPARTFGQPSVRNVRTEVLAGDYKAGSSRDELADLYELTLDQVDQALRFELIVGSDRAA
ncbi:DUF433 domain-containing protein [Microbacterium sp. H83]|uniref:DUF433 domain-containing protein n=1 Tax=Microbacterium sp. H83 TaxID=1827324 RepID=UPI0007F51A96|nr:DUF433 domain-containing protein [Microbacterium sp. H83]OAN33400.1 hypothetical protein A4X16_06995 [Microbacterium sp. H83]